MIPTPVARGARAQRPAYVYLLRSRVDGSCYLGWSTEPWRRVVEHNTAQGGFTSRKAPWQLLGVERHPTIEAAQQRERALKRSSRMLAMFKKRVLNQTAAGRLRQVWG